MINQITLKECLNYNSSSGNFVRVKKSGARGMIGNVAGCKNSNGYV